MKTTETGSIKGPLSEQQVKSLLLSPTTVEDAEILEDAQRIEIPDDERHRLASLLDYVAKASAEAKVSLPTLIWRVVKVTMAWERRNT